MASTEEMNPRILQVTADSTLEEVTDSLAQLPIARRMWWHLVVALPDGEWAVVTIADLQSAVEELGEAVWSRTLADIPGLLNPSPQVENTEAGRLEARRLRQENPFVRVIVSEADKPVGSLVATRRESIFGGFRSRLFGKERPRTSISAGVRVRCPVDGDTYPIADVVDLASDRLVCPLGHVIEE